MVKQEELSGVQPGPTLSVSGYPSISLRLMKLGDEEEFYKALSVGGPNLDKFQYWDNGFSPEAVKAEVERSVSEIEQGKMLRYEIVHSVDETESIIGEVSFYDHDEAKRTAYFGYLITAKFEGQGIVSASARELIQYASDRWGLERILMNIEVGNERSEHLAEKLGAHLTEGTKQVKTNNKTRNLRVWEVENE